LKVNIANWLSEAAHRWPNRPALFQGARQVADYEQFAARARAQAVHLRAVHDVIAGDRIAVFMKNCHEYLELLYAIWWVGAVAVPINCKLHAIEAKWIIENAEARLVFTDDGMTFERGDLPNDCRELVGQNDLARDAHRHSILAKPVSRCDSDLAWLFYTSGTTGRSKGVMLTHGNLMAMSLCYPVDVDQVSADDAVLYAAPMSHGAGLYNFIHVRCGARHIVPESRGFKSAEVFELSRTLNNVSLFAAPTMVKRMVEEARHQGYSGEGIKTIIFGGAPMYLADLRNAISVFGPRLVQIYGQGESPMTVSALGRQVIANQADPQWERFAASAGVAHSCIEIKVVGAKRSELPAGQPGEIAVRGATVMQGYWRNESATRNALEDGWLFTGDIGYLDHDGYLTLTDRSRDVIITGGSNVYPREVEEVLVTHPDVFEVCVVGEPDDEWGESIVAFVVVRQQVTLDLKALNSWFVARMASFKKPKKYVFCDKLPKNSYGKILKTELRNWLKQSAGTTATL
jgi:long-chain acyl-CoA synthetase